MNKLIERRCRFTGQQITETSRSPPDANVPVLKVGDRIDRLGGIVLLSFRDHFECIRTSTASHRITTRAAENHIIAITCTDRIISGRAEI